jgi:hypothetical protein
VALSFRVVFVAKFGSRLIGGSKSPLVSVADNRIAVKWFELISSVSSSYCGSFTALLWLIPGRGSLQPTIIVGRLTLWSVLGSVANLVSLVVGWIHVLGFGFGVV